MLNSQALITLGQWMAGEFNNQAQSAAQPAWFVHLRLWYRPLPQRFNGQLALFAEQANALYQHQSYRQRVAILEAIEPAGQLCVRYLAFKQPDKFRGAGANPNLLRQIHSEDLEALPGCELMVRQESDRFIAQPEPDAKCCFQYEGQQRQVVLGFEVTAAQFWSFDRGVDPETGQGLWGALLGPYEFQKCQDFSSEFPD